MKDSLLFYGSPISRVLSSLIFVPMTLHWLSIEVLAFYAQILAVASVGVACVLPPMSNIFLKCKDTDAAGYYRTTISCLIAISILTLVLSGGAVLIAVLDLFSGSLYLIIMTIFCLATASTISNYLVFSHKVVSYFMFELLLPWSQVVAFLLLIHLGLTGEDLIMNTLALSSLANALALATILVKSEHLYDVCRAFRWDQLVQILRAHLSISPAASIPQCFIMVERSLIGSSFGAFELVVFHQSQKIKGLIELLLRGQKLSFLSGFLKGRVHGVEREVWRALVICSGLALSLSAEFISNYIFLSKFESMPSMLMAWWLFVVGIGSQTRQLQEISRDFSYKSFAILSVFLSLVAFVWLFSFVLIKSQTLAFYVICGAFINFFVGFWLDRFCERAHFDWLVWFFSMIVVYFTMTQSKTISIILVVIVSLISMLVVSKSWSRAGVDRA